MDKESNKLEMKIDKNFTVIDTLIKQYQTFIDNLEIDTFNLEDLAADYPSRKARFALALETLKSKLNEAKAELKFMYYSLYKKYKEEAINEGIKVTEEHIKSKILTDEMYLDVQRKVLEFEQKVGILSACKEALEDFGRMLYLLADNPERKLNY